MNPRNRKNRGQKVASPSAVRLSPIAWLAVKLDMPAHALDGGVRLEMRGRYALVVHGCSRILDFSPREIRLLLGESTLFVGGEGLICTSYLAGAVGIEGLICSICFHDGEVDG